MIMRSSRRSMNRDSWDRYDDAPNGCCWKSYAITYMTDDCVIHRDDGPAIMRFDEKFSHPICMEWVVNGHSHRLDGPAKIEYHVDKRSYKIVNIVETWILHGCTVEKKDFDWVLDMLNNMNRTTAIMSTKSRYRIVREKAQQVLNG